MSFMTSHDSGVKPFNPDRYRGKWSHPTDFLFACIGQVFKPDTLIIWPVALFRELGIYALIPYILILAICAVPIVFIQSYLGQFSGTGFISAFRIAPLFKGIGYASLVLNVITLAYYSIFSAVPLFYLFYTLRSTIPWSCEGSKEWIHLKRFTNTPCAGNNTPDDIILTRGIPAVEFFKTHLDIHMKTEEPKLSWLLMVCACIVWIIVLLVSLRPIETIGRFIKFSYIGIIGVLALLLIRFLFLPNALVGLSNFVMPANFKSLGHWLLLPSMALATIGPGWGSILSMASFNDFKANIYSYSWITSLVQLVIMLGMCFMSMLMWGFMIQANNVSEVVSVHRHQDYFSEFLIIPTGLTKLELPHFWSVIFFVMMLLGTLNLLIVQLLSVLTSVFDEFESLRGRKREITLGAVGALALSSIYFCSNHGIDFMEFLAKSTIATQMLLNLLLILVVLWIYGRERFQKDVKFMTNHLYSLFMISIVRFITPLCLLLALLLGVLMGLKHTSNRDYNVIMDVIAAVVAVVPWCLIPWYCIYRLMRTSGAMKLRLKRSVKPTDWYPADPLYKQRYKQTFNKLEAV